MQNFSRFSTCAALLFGLALVGNVAQANLTQDYGNIIPGDIPGDLTLTNEVGYGPGTSFFDVYLFDLVHPASPGPGVTVDIDVENLVDAQAVIPFTVELYRYTGGGYELITSRGPAETVNFTEALSTSTTAFQQYRITIAGLAPIDATAGYAAFFVVTAVPEPSSTSLLAIGLGLVCWGLGSRRRRFR